MHKSCSCSNCGEKRTKNSFFCSDKCEIEYFKWLKAIKESPTIVEGSKVLPSVV